MGSRFSPPRHVVWSTDTLDLSDPYQRKWYMAQVLRYGRAEDLGTLNLDEVAQWLEELPLPEDVRALWRAFLKERSREGA